MDIDQRRAEEFIRNTWDHKWKIFLRVLGVLIAINLLWSTWYINTSEYNAVEQRLGKYTKTTGGGLNFKCPWPICTRTKVPVNVYQRATVGFKEKETEVEGENEVLTQDLNIVLLDFVIQYQISDPARWLFTAQDPEGAVKDNGQAAMRLVIGGTSVDEALTSGRSAVQTAAEKELQERLDAMGIGVKITKIQLQDVHPPKDVADAFKDVNTALEEKTKKVNEATGYANQVIPQARGEASKLVEDANAYKIEKTEYAKGDVARFEKNLEEYQKAPAITKQRMQLEAIGSILAGKSQKVMDINGILNLNNLSK